MLNPPQERKTLRQAITGTLRERLLSKAKYRPIFICGISGSGTSLLANLLDERFLTCGVANESALNVPDDHVRMGPADSYNSLAEYAKALKAIKDYPSNFVRDCYTRLYRSHTRASRKSNAIIDKAPNAHLMRAAKMAEAFTDGYFVFVFRDPVDQIEGLRRKWTLFRDAEISDLCLFVKDCHDTFLTDSAAFPDRRAIISYEDFLVHHDQMLDWIRHDAGLITRRKERKRGLRNRPNVPGKGLRNVVNGKIVIDSQSFSKPPSNALSDAETGTIRELMSDHHKDMRRMAIHVDAPE